MGLALGRSLFGLISLVMLAGCILFQFFVILSGAVYSTPENQIYFLETTTGNIPGNAPHPKARWTFFAVCGVNEHGHNANCLPRHPALPFSPPDTRNFNTTVDVPSEFIHTSKYFYESRFMFAFYLIALFFAVVAFFTCFLAICARLAAMITSVTTGIALFFQILSASLMTAWTVQGRHNFNKNGYSAHLGTKAYAFTWTAVALLMIALVLLCLAGKSVGERRETAASTGGGRFAGYNPRNMFRRNRSVRSNVSRGSFIDSERSGMGGGRIKEEYE